MARNTSYGRDFWPSLGPYLFSGAFLQKMFSRLFQGGISEDPAITATAGGTKAAAYALANTFNRVAVCATTGDSVLMPPAIAGSRCSVLNSGAQTLNVYGRGTDTIDGVATGTANTIATTKYKEYTCYVAGAWFTTSILA